MFLKIKGEWLVCKLTLQEHQIESWIPPCLISSLANSLHLPSQNCVIKKGALREKISP